MQDSSTFETLILSPADAAHPGLAVAAARAGGVGLLDLEFARDAAALRRNFAQLHAATLRQASTPGIGLRLSAADLGCVRELIATVAERPLTLMLHGDVTRMASLARTLRQDAPQHRLLAEITHPAMAEGLVDVVDALVAKGHESGGWVGEDTSYILAQKLIGKTSLPLLLRGGVGRHSAAATALMGAAGVVLDDQVLLLAESPLSETHQRNVARLNGAETQLFGEQIEMPCRIFGARGSAELERIKQASRQVEAGQLSQADWREALNKAMGWGADQLLPIGQGIGVAAMYRDQYRSVGRLVQALRAQLEASRNLLAQHNPLAENSPLAASHGTRFPIAQGPMTRVSDSPAFADAVASGGALPFLALALMRGEQVDTLLAETAQVLGDKPWGVGILGFVPQALREEQCAAVFRHKPDYALIAGGRPDQAAEFESRGIPAYLHAPAPALLKLYLEQGARRFVFEGRECGGHIGPIASFPLWEQMIEVLLAEVSEAQAADVHLFFAGGINDARSSAMIAALTAPLVERGMKVGVLMGTAYLFTREIVETGAIVPGFQHEALACTATCSLETGPGHSTRCANTEFSREFFRQRRALLQSDKSADDIRDELEDLNMGRLRVASKGRDRDASGQIVELDEAAQKLRGMYMIGQVATLHDKVLGVEELHLDVSQGAGDLLTQLATRDTAEQGGASPSDIAIVGIGMILPQIDSADDFWGKVLRLESTITEVPKDRWDEALYFDPDKNARDKVYSRWGGFLDEVVFDPTSFGIAPSSMKSIDPMQLLSLECTARALRDAGMGPGQADFDREHTSIILGAGGGIGDLGMQLGLRSELPRFVEDPEDAVWDRLPEWTNESFAGVLLNVTAGRIANRLDFGGVNFTVDAACGSSLAAITLATQELESGRSNVAIAGGVDTVQGPFGYLCFSKTQALSPQGKARTFDRDADGIVISEGVCVTVMKRLADAERDGERIYAVIKAASGSSDGRALGMTAPLPKGQQRALNRAYRKAGFSPASLGLVEAHGTGTAVGDKAEAETVTSTLIEAGADVRSVALGSVKTLVGHTKCAAGVTGLVKTALSLHHRVLPGHAGVENPIDVIADEAAPTYLLKQPRPWLREPNRPRRAAVSAFGFGGTNFHAVLEEYRTGWGQDAPVGAQHWPVELCVFRAADRTALEAQLNVVSEALDQALRTDIGLTPIAAALAQAAARERGAAQLCFTAADLTQLRARLSNALSHLRDGQALSAGSHLTLQRPQQAPKLGVLFPGQGAQYVGMLRGAALYLPQLREAWEQADTVLAPELGQPVSAIAWPAAAFDPATAAAQRERLTDTRHAQPALGAAELGLWRWMQNLGLSADAVGGHSYGEYSALMAAGVLSDEDFLRLSAARGRVMAEAARTAPAGTMAAVLSERSQVEALIKDIADVAVANHNAPRQTVITGSVEGIEAALAACAAAEVSARKLPVGGAFHSPLMRSAQDGLSQAIDAAQFQPAQCAVYSNMSGARYPDGMAGHLKQHLLSSVEFVRQIEAMQAEGIELFLELGPKTILAGMLREIVPQVECLSVDREDGELAPLLDTLAQLSVRGFDLDLPALFAGRSAHHLELRQLKTQLARPALPRTAWMVAGGYARPLASEVRSNGVLEALSQADKDAAIAQRRSQPRAAEPAAPAAAVAPAVPSVAPSGALNGDALVAYQDTMRQFLKLQEAVMAQALGIAPTTDVPEQTVSLPMPAAVPAAVTPVDPHQAIAEPAAAAPLPVEPAPVARVDVAAVVLEIVAERTGYPQDMLDPAADMEADLGIDSIKRVEVVGAVQKALPEAAASAMQADLETYTRAKTLDSLIAAVNALVGEQPVASAPVAAPAAAPAPSVDVAATLLSIVAERTGYPEDMLDAQADLEADLGIDSIKRVEIVGALQKALPDAVASAMQADLETYTRAKSLQVLIAAVEALTAQSEASAVPAAQTAQAAPVAEPTESASHVPRYVIRPRQAALPSERTQPRGLVIVVDGPDSIREPLVERIAATGATPVELLIDEPRALKNELELAIKTHGPVRAVMHLGGLSQHPEDSFAQWRKTGANTVGKLFTLLKALGDERDHLHLIAATRLGGTLGREAEGVGSALAGGAAGMINCYRQEYPEAIARLVDFDGQTDEVIAEHLFDELCSTDPHREIGYLGDTRYTVSTQEHALHDHAFAAHLEPQDGWVVLATGGARGITAEILLRMAKPGLRYVLIGRTALPDPNDLHLEHATALHLKGALIADARVNGNMPKPAELDQRVAQIMAGREVLDNLQRMRDAGVEVDYVPCDVRDVASFGAAIEDVYTRCGRIDGVIHGAGVIEDKLIADKTAVSFDRVFGTKTDSAWILANTLKPETLKWVAFFTSVAGRYGNRGQADYAAANEALNRYAWQLSRRWKDTRVMAINWGPWDAGMASDAVKAKFREQGILPIPVDAGARYFLDELAYGPKSEVELVVGEGPWAVYDGEQDAEEAGSDLPLIRAGLHIGAGGTLVLDHHFSVESDPYLLDHSMDGKPVLPAAGAAEWMAQVAAAGWPGWQVAEVRDLKVLAGVVLDPARGRKVAFKARASTHSQPGEQMLAIDIVDPERNQALYKAKVRLVERLPDAPQLDASAVSGDALDASQAYRDYLFHGGDFQLIDQIQVVGRGGVDAQARRSRPAAWLRQDGVATNAHWVFDPGLLDCGPQLAIVWSRRFLDKTALPSAFGSVCRYGRDPLPERLGLYLRIRGEASESSLNYDVLLADDEGRVRLEMREIEGTASAALNRLASADA